MNNIVVANKFGREKSISNLDPNFFPASESGMNISVKKIIDKPYQFHSIIYSCIRCYTDSIAPLPRVVCEKDNTQEYIREHEILDLLDNPNPLMTGTQFWEAIIINLLLTTAGEYGREDTGGQVFLIAYKKNKKVDLRAGEIPDQIYPFSNRFVKPKIDNSGRLIGWVYQTPCLPETKLEFETYEIIRINYFNPYNVLKGMSPLAALDITLQQDVDIDIYNQMFIDNGAVPSGVLQTDENLTEQQQKEGYKRWNQRHGGRGNVNKVAILSNGLKYQKLSLDHSDMQWDKQKEYNIERFLAAFGLNKIALGMYEKINYATIKEGRKILWQDKYAPMDKMLCKVLNDSWIKHVGGKDRQKPILIKTDYSEVPELREDYTTRAKNAGLMVSQLKFTPKLASDIVGIPLPKDVETKYPWLDEQPTTIGAMAMSNDDPKIKTLAQRQLTTKQSIDVKADEKDKFSDKYIAKVLDPGEKVFIPKIKRLFSSQVRDMLNKVDQWLKKQDKNYKTINELIKNKFVTKGLTPKEFLPDNINDENSKLMRIYKPFAKGQMKRETAQLDDELEGLIAWNVTNDTIEEFVEKRAAILNGINHVTFEGARKKVNDAIAASVAENMTPQETAKMVKEAIRDVGKVREGHAMTIARTETGSISSDTRYSAFQKEGIERHQWITANDERVRIGTVAHPDWNHRDVNGAIVKVREVFPVVLLRRPLDPKGAAGNIINCRCVAVAVEAK